MTGGDAGPGATRARWLLAATCIPLLAQSLDVSGMGLLLPSIGATFDDSPAVLGWVMNANPVMFGALLIPMGRLADRIGPRPLLLAGVTGFGLASLWCAWSPDVVWLVVGRGLQGVASAACFTTSLAVVSAAFDDRRRPGAIGIWSAVSGVGSALGPMLSGALASGPGWRWFFLVNGPLCLLAVPALAALVPRRASDTRQLTGDDPTRDRLAPLAVGVAFIAVSVVAGRMGTPRWSTLATLAAAVVAGVAVAVAVRRRERIVHAAALSGRFTRTALVVGFCSTWGFGVTLVVIGQYLQDTRGLDPVTAGAVFLGYSVAFAVAGVRSGHLEARLGLGRTLAVAMSISALGIAGMLAFTADTAIAALVGVLAVAGVGQGLAFSSSTTASLAGVDTDLAGETTAVTQTVRLLGSTLGVALSAAIAAVAATRDEPDAALGAERVSMGLALLVALAGLAATLTHGRGRHGGRHHPRSAPVPR